MTKQKNDMSVASLPPVQDAMLSGMTAPVSTRRKTGDAQKAALAHAAFEVPLSEIDIPADRARDLDPAWAEALAGMIAERGLINPITVRIVDGRKRLVTGLHRHAAFVLLKREAIPVRISAAASDDEARLEEVMENLGRNELKALDRCHHLYELKQVYEALYPEAKHGGDRKSGIKAQKLRFDQDARCSVPAFDGSD